MLLCFVQLRIGGGRGEERYKKQTVEIITSGTLASLGKTQHWAGRGETSDNNKVRISSSETSSQSIPFTRISNVKS